jgi:hypothetical protein
MPKVDHEERFYQALKEIASYMTTAQLRRDSEKRYGLSYEEGLEGAYENVVGTAKWALKGYRRKRAATKQPLEPAKATAASAAL